MKYLRLIPGLLVAFVIGCKKEKVTQTAPAEQMYFPSNTDTVWERKTIADLGWNANGVQALKDYLIQSHTKSFMILVNGRIVMEEYFDGHTPTTTWQWNSAGKTLVGTTTGIAQQENFLNINNKVSQYLGNWTNAPLDKENLINIKHLISMTTGLSDSSQLVIKSKMTYMADAGSRWAYSNFFQKQMDVIAAATQQDFETYFNAKLKNKLGMDGFWDNGLIYKIYHSNTRSMARFGLMALNKGKWNNEQIVNEAFFNESITSSQNINPSYGYFWWLNGKTSYMVPGGQTVYQGTLVPNAPADMYSAMGAEDNRIYVIPGKKMVVIRMGSASDPNNPSFALSGFDNKLWEKINGVIQ